MSGRVPTLLLLLSLPASIAVAGQEVPRQLLVTPDAEFPTPFERVSEIRELQDGRVLVLESRVRTLRLVDFTTRTARRVGREGSGPGEYSYPLRLIALPGDTSLVFDANNARYLIIHPDGSVGRFLDLGAPVGSPGAVELARLGSSIASDTAGLLYARGLPRSVAPEGDRVARADSAPVIRWDRRRNARDTVAVVPVRAQGGRLGPGGIIVRPAQVVAFRTQDQWAVSPDGRVAVVYLNPYRVTMIVPSGGLVRGPSLPHMRIRTTEEHKRQWREELAALQPTSRSAGSRIASYFEPSEWPEYLPPFLERAVTFASDGILWIKRTGPAGEGPSYDLVDERAQLVARVGLRGASRVVGFGAGSVYVIRRDADDLEYLQRFALPRIDRR